MKDYLSYFAVIAFILLAVLISSYLLLGPRLGPGQFLVEDDANDRMIVEVGHADEVERKRVTEETKLYLTGDSRWMGGELEPFDSKHGFRFDPETLVVANFTAEALQAVYFNTIRDDYDYWANLGTVYVRGTVVKIPE